MGGNADNHRAAHAAFNAGKLEELRAMCTHDMQCVDHPRGLTMKNPDEFVGWLQEWKTGMSDAEVGDPTYADAGDTTVARFSGRGTHDGQLGPVPATGKRLDMPFCEVAEWSDGKTRRSRSITTR